MAKECKVFRSDGGKTFDTLYEALVDDFETLVLAKCGNEAIARQVVQGLTAPAEALDEFAAVVTALVAEQPPRVHGNHAADNCTHGVIVDSQNMTEFRPERMYSGPTE